VDCWFAHPPDRPDPNSEDSTRERYSRSLFIGRLSVGPGTETDDADLQAYFSQFGEIVVCSVARINKDKSGKSRGFGLVEYAKLSSVDRAFLAGHPSWSVQRRKVQHAGGTFLSSTDRRHRIAIDSTEMALHPEDIRFTHGRISFCFKDGKLVDDTIEKCMSGAARFEDLPPLRVVRNPQDGYYYSLSNRRLFVARVLSRKGFRFGLHKDSECIQVRAFPFSNEHVQAQWMISCRTLSHSGRFVVPSWRCGTCKGRHESKYINQHTPPHSLRELESAMREESERREAALGHVLGISDATSEDGFDSDFD